MKKYTSAHKGKQSNIELFSLFFYIQKYIFDCGNTNVYHQRLTFEPLWCRYVFSPYLNEYRSIDYNFGINRQRKMRGFQQNKLYSKIFIKAKVMRLILFRPLGAVGDDRCRLSIKFCVSKKFASNLRSVNFELV